MDKLSLKNDLVDGIYKSITNIYNDTYNLIIITNLADNLLIDYQYPIKFKTNKICYFTRKDVKYWNDKWSNKDKMIAKKNNMIKIINLNEKFYVEFDSIINKLDKLSEKKKYIQTYVRNVMNEAETIADIYALMPVEAHEYLPSCASTVTLTNEEISDFKKDNKKYLSLLKVKLLNKFMVKK